MDAIVYYVILQNNEQDSKRAKQLEHFLHENNFEVVQTYYDVNTNQKVKNRLGFRSMMKDLKDEKIKADAFICLSITDMINRKSLIECLTEINDYMSNIYFVSIESGTNGDNNDDDIA